MERRITQKEFNALPVIDGVRQCPSNTDYSLIKSFGEWCSFGERCSFGEGCSFGELCSFGGSVFKNKRIVQIHSIGESGGISIWRGADGVDRFQVGCRFGDEKAISEAVREKYGENSLYQDGIKLLKRIMDKEVGE